MKLMDGPVGLGGLGGGEEVFCERGVCCYVEK